MSNFKTTHTLEKRKSEAARINNKYSDRFPVIVEIDDNEKEEIGLDKYKYLIPNDLTVGQFMYVLRKRIKLDDVKALFIFINNTIPPTAHMMGGLYNKHKDVDGFLYVKLTLENTFG